MKPTDSLQLAADVRDLQILDSDGEFCGIVDDLELEGRPGGELKLTAILVGPGAYRHRLPGWASWAICRVAGDGLVRVDWSEVETITSRVKLKRPADALGLATAEKKAARWLPRLRSGDAPG